MTGDGCNVPWHRLVRLACWARSSRRAPRPAAAKWSGTATERLERRRQRPRKRRPSRQTDRDRLKAIEVALWWCAEGADQQDRKQLQKSQTIKSVQNVAN
jgi:hypothetical protein